MNRTALVTGGAGYIGSHVCKLLACVGVRPVVYDDLSTGHRGFVKWGPLVEGDILDENRLEAVLTAYRPEFVLHLAAKSLISESISNPQFYSDVNIGGTAAVVTAMQRAGCARLVLSSSAAVYGVGAEVPITESQAIDPITPYGASKAQAEDLVLSARNIDAIALRYFNAAGADAECELWEWHEPERHLIPLVLDAASGLRPSISVFGRDYPTPDGTAVRDYVHVMDIAAAHILAARALGRGSMNRPINLGSGRGTSVGEIIQAAERVTQRQIPVVDENRREGDPPILTADPDVASQVLGWRPYRSNVDRILTNAWNSHPGRCRRAA